MSLYAIGDLHLHYQSVLKTPWQLQRLRKSLELAGANGYRKYIMFLHYPPTNILEERSGFTDIAEEYVR